MGTVKIIGPKDNYKGPYINTTSKSDNWSKELSPFYLGPIELYGGFISSNMENAWQYTKVYEEHCIYNDVYKQWYPTNKYIDWAKEGFNNTKAIRYPMGKNAIPLYSLWQGQGYDYIAARKKIYIPLYAKAVVNTRAYKHLVKLYNDGYDIVLWDFDGYDHKALNMNYKDVINCESKKMGHAFVIGMLLEEFITFEKNNLTGKTIVLFEGEILNDVY